MLSLKKPDRLHVAEMFYSLQGEGPTVGHPAVFLRLQHCNLLCGTKRENEPTWICDTIDVWRQGKPLTFPEILSHWQEKEWLEHLDTNAHLVITGGEPLLQQHALLKFLAQLAERAHPWVEIETNATILVHKELDHKISQYNCSPKGKNSGNPERLRHNPMAIRELVRNPKAIFKFVVNSATDVAQITHEYVERYDISPTRVWLMPGADNRSCLQQTGKVVFDLCKTWRYNYSTRLQIQLWNQTTGI